MKKQVTRIMMDIERLEGSTKPATTSTGADTASRVRFSFSVSLLCASERARNTTTATLAISDGWKEATTKFIRRPPPASSTASSATASNSAHFDSLAYMR